MNKFATYIITSGLKTSSISKLEAKGQEGGLLFPGLPGMFTTALIAKTGTDTSPTTAWISSGWMSEEEIAHLNAQLPGPFEYSDGTFDTTIDGKAVKVSENGHAFMARKGYRMKPESV